MKFQAHFLRNFMGIQRRKFDLWGFHCIQSPNVHAFFSPTQRLTTCLSASGDSVRGSEVVKDVRECPENAAQVFRKWGCSEIDINRVFSRQPLLRRADVSDIDSKLKFLSELGLGLSDIVKMIIRRPRLLRYSIGRYFSAQIDDLRALFGSNELFLKAVVRNPTLLLYDFDNTVKPVISLYEELGVVRRDLISMILIRPTLIARTTMGEEKLEYIRRMGVSKKSKMFKYVVTIMGVSRIETIREKVANLQKFGFSEDEVLQLFGRSPLFMTLSPDKVQRNMTFVVGTMKLPANTILSYTFLVYSNLDNLLKPRVLLARKIQGMGLSPQMEGPQMFRALRMTEKRFLKVYVKCHQEDIKDELLDYYRTAKRTKRLAESSRKSNLTYGFPF